MDLPIGRKSVSKTDNLGSSPSPRAKKSLEYLRGKRAVVIDCLFGVRLSIRGLTLARVTSRIPVAELADALVSNSSLRVRVRLPPGILRQFNNLWH